ncbi:MAG: transcription elongation factor GreA [Clostridiales bacterium]|jgi:transcription elongation factor GreA|nr:transcription elongation factor GreA [Clostridiales bacterium]
MGKQVVLTFQGKEELEKELEILQTVRRKEIAETIKQAREFGDLSENAEYDEAKNEQAKLELRIIEIENKLKNATVIDEEDIKSDVVSIGCKVRVRTEATGEEQELFIVGSTEANPFQGRISDESPVGAALLGASIGKTVKAETPSGVRAFKVLAITT